MLMIQPGPRERRPQNQRVRCSSMAYLYRIIYIDNCANIVYPFWQPYRVIGTTLAEMKTILLPTMIARLTNDVRNDAQMAASRSAGWLGYQAKFAHSGAAMRARHSPAIVYVAIRYTARLRAQ